MNAHRVSRLQQVLLGPLVSEKSARSGERENSVAFWVIPDATKHEIKAAVEMFFPKAKVESVRTLVQHRDFVTFGNRKGGRAKKRKKAYVSLAEGTEIQFAEFEQ